MKRLLSLILTATALSVATAAVPLRWNVETSRLQPVVFDAVRGESFSLEATFNSYGNPLSMDGKPCQIFWQTNGMGAAWWQASATATSNRIAATFTPQMDPGANVVNGFLGSTGDIYRAAFALRFRNGPGATPNALPLPTPTIDCQKVTFLHPEAAPFSGGGSGGVNTNAVRDIASSASVTNAGAVAVATNFAAQAKSEAISTASADATAKATAAENAAKAASKPADWQPDFSTNNTALVTTITNLAPTRARALSLHDPTRNCNWYPCVTNGVFYWLIED